MKLTLAEIQAIDRSLPSITRHPLPVKISYRLSKLISFCAKEIDIMENIRKDLVKKFSGEDGCKEGEIRVKNENEEKFRYEFSELLKEEIDFDFEPVDLKDLGDIKVAPIDIFILEKIIKLSDQ